MGKSAKDIKEVVNRTHEACIRIIDKQFKAMDNFADRDHCVQVCPLCAESSTKANVSQYMVGTMLVFGRLTASDYADGSEAATSPLLEDLRKRIRCVEDPKFTQDYHEPSKRTIPNALTVTLNDGTVLDEVVIEAPLGHYLRRDEARPEILAKYKRHLSAHFDAAHADKIYNLGIDRAALENTDIDQYVDLHVKEKMIDAA